MAGTLCRSLLKTTLTYYSNSTTNLRSLHTATVCHAARKGTREKARAKKIKVEVTKVGFIPHNQRGKKVEKVSTNKHVDDSYKQVSKDDVYPMRYYQWPLYTAEEAVKAHQETHHPSMYNQPDALVFAKVEFNMEAIKKNKYLESTTKLSILPNNFPRDEERTILAFCKGAETIKSAMEAGATVAGGTEIIKKIQEGQIKLGEFEYIVAHPNILTELVPLRGLMKRRFPSLKTGNMDVDIPALVKKFASGIQYKILKDEAQPNFGSTQVPVGRVNMDAKLVAENIEALLKDIQASRPKRDGLYITRCIIVSPPSSENLKIDPFVYVDRTLSKEVQEESDDEDELVQAKA